MAAQPAEFIFSTSALPPSGVDCASPNTGSILAPPSDLMPPALISSSASDAPMRPCCPEYDIAPDTGWRMPIFTGCPCARRTAGAASAAAPRADEARKRRRLNGKRDMRFSPPDHFPEPNIALHVRLRLDLAQLRVVRREIESRHDAGQLRTRWRIEFQYQRVVSRYDVLGARRVRAQCV